VFGTFGGCFVLFSVLKLLHWRGFNNPGDIASLVLGALGLILCLAAVVCGRGIIKLTGNKDDRNNCH
jgi:hypothetical protein